MSALEEGHLLGRYRVEAFVAEGGMGQIYRAVDTLLGRRVALKVLAGGAPHGSAAVARLLREARAAAALSHPNICAVFDVGEAEGRPFIAMELVEGASLRSLIASPDVGIDQRLRWIHDLAGALAAAHRANLVHRDIKPDNVMVGGDGRVRLLDFGIARWADGGDPGTAGSAPGTFRTQDGQVLGTVGYMAPEQARGGPVDARADQFAWGVLAYETLSGRHPFGVDGGFGDPPLVSTRAPALPFGVAAIVAKALALDPAQRFADMDELVAALGPLAGAPTAPPDLPDATVGTPATSSDAPVTTRARTAPRRRARRWRWAAIALAAAVIGSGAAVWVAHAPSHPSTVPGGVPPAVAVAFELALSQMRRVTFGDGCDEFPSFLPDGRALVYDGDDDADHTVLYRIDLEDGAAPRVLVRQDDPGRDTNPSVSPAGVGIAFVHNGAQRAATVVARVDGGSPHAIGATTSFPRWSPDGRAVWTIRGGVYGLYDATTDAVLRTVVLPTGLYAIWLVGRADGPAVAQVGSALASTPSAVLVFDAGGRLRHQLHDDFEPALALTPDGRHVLASRKSIPGQVELVAIPLDGSPVVSLASTGVAARDGLDVSPDGRRIAWSTCHPVPRLTGIDAAGRAFPTLTGEGADAIAIARIPESGDLAVVSSRTSRPLLWVMDPSGARPPRRITPLDRDVHDVAISGDGTRFAVSLPGTGIGVGTLRGEPNLRVVTDNPGDGSPWFRKAGDDVVFARPAPDGTRQAMVVPFAGGAAAPLLAPQTRFPTVSPLDDTIVYATKMRSIPLVADARGRGARPLSPALPVAAYSDLRFSADGRRVLVLSDNHELLEIDVASGAILRTVTAEPRELFYSPSYGPGDSGLIVIRVRWQGSIYVAEAAFGSPRTAESVRP
jgi:Tol biopolymer transport system component